MNDTTAAIETGRGYSTSTSRLDPKRVSEFRAAHGADPPEVVNAEIVPGDGDPAAPVAVPDASAAVLAALDEAAYEHLDDVRPAKTVTGYARDWALWTQYHGWLAERTGHTLPLTTVTPGTLVGFVRWLDQVAAAAPNSIERRVTGVTVTARRLGAEVPKAATLAARAALKPLLVDPVRMARGRGKAVAATPEHLRAMALADPVLRPGPDAKRRKPRELPEITRIRDRALATMAFSIAGRSSEVSALTVEGITVVAESLEVHVSSVKGRPARTVPVHRGDNPETCPVRCWLAWKDAAALVDGPAFRPVDQVGRVGAARLSPDGCRIAITRAAERAGLDVRLTGHSARRGLVTTGRKKGKKPEKLRKQSGHSANSPVLWSYVEDGEMWEDAATEGLGL
ncbi:tyrosine-type recombinase/integrase [Embleya sp. NPDC127516]|uniref:tyrosine-type recombinase/integrase n=1 Tax=Embleya sp. NPDC127516 TaxID=3363990 RepID=UPI00381D9008